MESKRRGRPYIIYTEYIYLLTINKLPITISKSTCFILSTFTCIL